MVMFDLDLTADRGRKPFASEGLRMLRRLAAKYLAHRLA